MHLDHVTEFGRHHEFGARIDQRNAEDFEGLGHVLWLDAESGLEQVPARGIKELEEAAVENDPGRIAIGPVDGEMPLVDEVAHEDWFPFGTGAFDAAAGGVVSNRWAFDLAVRPREGGDTVFSRWIPAFSGVSG